MKKPLPPFFIVGCARSGTTLLRDVLRLHPNLNAPEETFFYRWGHPFGTDAYKQIYIQNKTVRMHQTLDGLDSKRVKTLLSKSHSRREFNVRYTNSFLKQTKGQRWFDKTPQNIYGLLLLRAQFPTSPIVHIYRNPLNVVASLMLGKVMPKQTLVAAVNYWLEAAQIINIYRSLPENNLLELKYEDLLATPQAAIKQLLEALGEDVKAFDFTQIVTEKSSTTANHAIYIQAEDNKYLDVLSEKEVNYVCKQCSHYMTHYGYGSALSD